MPFPKQSKTYLSTSFPVKLLVYTLRYPMTKN